MDSLAELRTRVRTETSKVVVGREAEVDLLLVALASEGHALLEGVPGTSKTLLAKCFARTLGLSFKRVQFTPDMLPLDVVGGFVMNMKSKEIEFREGPVFANILLADEINRSPPKVQSALLEAMQELQVTVEGHTRVLPRPFMVIATENPVESEGVYPLPEGQLDRFTLKVPFGYQGREVEGSLIGRNLLDMDLSVITVAATEDELRSVLQAVKKVSVSPELLDYLARIAEYTRKDPRVELGASPRAMVHLAQVARAYASLNNRSYVTPDDIKQMAPYVLGHRLVLKRSALLKGEVSGVLALLTGVLAQVKPPR
jgi:MoxR-like ATPase